MADRGEQAPPYDHDSVDIAAGATVALGLNGQQGDYLKAVVVRNFAGATAGAVQIKDGTDAAITIFFGALIAAGLNSEVRPWTIPLGIRSRTGGWSVINGTNVESTGIGRFTGGT